MGSLCTACLNLIKFVFQSDRNVLFLQCLAGMITLLNHTKNPGKLISFGVTKTSLARELFMNSWKGPEQGSNMPRIKYWRVRKLYVQMHWHQNLVKCLWRKITKCNFGNAAFSSRIENETGSQNITNMWRDHYQHLFNSVKDTNDKPYVLSYIRNNHDTIDAVITMDDIICSIKELPNN